MILIKSKLSHLLSISFILSRQSSSSLPFRNKDDTGEEYQHDNNPILDIVGKEFISVTVVDYEAEDALILILSY